MTSTPAHAFATHAIVGPAIRHPAGIPALIGLIMTAITVMAGRARMHQWVRRLDIPTAGINLVGSAMILWVVLTQNKVGSLPALATSIGVPGFFGVIWVTIIKADNPTAWSSLRIASAIVGMILLATPVIVGTSCGTSCINIPSRPH